MKTKQKVQWFARGAGIARMGPFHSQARAVGAMTLAEGCIKNPAFPYPDDLFVWPEIVTKKGKP